MAIDIFLKLGDIDGESQDDKHKNEIEVMSYSFGASNFTRAAAGSGSGTGKVNLQDFHFVMRASKASPSLFVSCASGTHIKEATLTVRKAGATQQDFLTYTFSDVLVSSYQTGGAGADLPTDQISLNFSKLETSYAPQDDKGGLGTAVTGVWDVKLNTSS